MSTPQSPELAHPFTISTRRHGGWSPETSPTSSEDSETSLDREADEMDTAPPSPSHSGSTSIMIPDPSPSASPSSRLSKSPTSLGNSSLSTPSMHPYRPQGSRPASRTPSVSPPKVNLPKSQPLSRALFARLAMAEIPKAGQSDVGGGMPKKMTGKQKMIVATKPMRTTFELGLSSSELARRA